MEDIRLKIGQFCVVERKLTMPVIRLAYSGVIGSGEISLVCMLGVGQGATSYNLFTRINQTVNLGVDIIKTVKVTSISNHGEEITLKIN